MRFPVGLEDIKVVRGRSTGLQVTCTCGCVNFNYLDPQDTLWRCRNCQRILSNDFPRLLERAAERENLAAAEAAAAAIEAKGPTAASS
jgi:hypothetical protein